MAWPKFDMAVQALSIWKTVSLSIALMRAVFSGSSKLCRKLLSAILANVISQRERLDIRVSSFISCPTFFRAMTLTCMRWTSIKGLPAIGTIDYLGQWGSFPSLSSSFCLWWGMINLAHCCYLSFFLLRYSCQARTSSPLNDLWFSCAFLRKASTISVGIWTVIFRLSGFVFMLALQIVGRSLTRHVRCQCRTPFSILGGFHDMSTL